MDKGRRLEQCGAVLEEYEVTQQNWSTRSQTKPPVVWNANTKTFSIVLSGSRGSGANDTLEAEWKPPVTYVVRIRESEGGSWSVGFETPLTACGFVYLKSDTEYEVEVRSKNANGESEPVRRNVRTNPEGALVV